MSHPYEKCKDVKVMIYTKYRYIFWNDDDDQSQPERWTAFYHQTYRKYMVTNNTEENKAWGGAEIAVIGFADSLDSIMYVVWEHQVSRGCERTVLDDVRAYRRELNRIAAEREADEWKWAKPADEPKQPPKIIGMKRYSAQASPWFKEGQSFLSEEMKAHIANQLWGMGTLDNITSPEEDAIKSITGASPEARGEPFSHFIILPTPEEIARLAQQRNDEEEGK